MRADWHLRRLGDVCTIQPPKSEARQLRKPDDLVSFVPMEALSIERKEPRVAIDRKFSEVAGSYTYFANNDVLLAKITPCFENGKLGIASALTNGIGFGSSEFIVLRPSDALIPDFLYYFLLQDSFRKIGAKNMTGTAGQKRVTRTFVETCQIPLPPKKEQERIAATLDTALEGIGKARANLTRVKENAEHIFNGFIAKAFGERNSDWRMEAIGELAEHSLGKMLDKAKNRGVRQPYLRNLNVRWFEFDLSDLNQMPFLPEEFARYSINKGDVVICEGGYPGRAAIWDSDDPIYFQKALHRVRFANPLHAKWFVYYLYSQNQMGLLNQWFTGTGILHFTGEALDRFQIPIPPDTELRKFVAKFDSLRLSTLELDRVQKQKLTSLEALKQSLLHQAFSGNL